MSADLLDRLRAMNLEALLSSPEMDFQFKGKALDLKPFTSWPAVAALREAADLQKISELAGVSAQFPEAGVGFTLASFNLGTEFIVDRARGGDERYAEVIKINSTAWLFAIGWKILYDEVIMSSAQAVLDLLDRSSLDSQAQFLKRALTKAVKDGEPWIVVDRFEPLSKLVGPETAQALQRLCGKFPQMPGEDGPIYSMDQVQGVFLFLSEI